MDAFRLEAFWTDHHIFKYSALIVTFCNFLSSFRKNTTKNIFCKN